MNMSDVCNIEFIDLSEVDENEQIRVRMSLQSYDPSVQLPWIKTDKKFPFPAAKPTIKRKNDKNSNLPKGVLTNPDYVHTPMTSSSAVNNVFLNHEHFPQQTIILPPLISNYPVPPHQSNALFYANNLSPIPSTYPQQQVYVIPQSTINNVHNYPNISYPYTTTTTHIHMQNNVTNAHVGQVELASHQIDHSKPEMAPSTHILNQMVTTPNTVVNINPIQSNPTVPLQSLVIQNGDKDKPHDKENTVNSLPAIKSWASLFNSRKSSNHVNNHAADGGMEKAMFDQAVNKEYNKNDTVCPIKNPKKSQFVHPDCYRMGEYLISYSVDGRAVSLQPRGLINQSTYCYINSILQALAACPPLYNLLFGLSQNISSNEKRKPTPFIDGMCRFVKEFKHLPANMRVSNRRSEGKNQKKEHGLVINTDIPFEPSWIYKMLNGIRTDLIEGRQEDAEEFLGCLLNGLNDEMLELIKLVKNDSEEIQKTVNNVESEPDQDKEWQVMGPKNKCSVTRRTEFGRTPISDIFGGFLKSRIHRAGDHVTENIQPFFTLQLNIEKVKTVREALEALITKYQLEGLTSSKTNEEVEAWQQVMLDELPIILILHLKCFDFKLDGCTKIIKALEFPIDLKIDSKLLSSKSQTPTPKEKQYKLFAVVYHDGKEASKGHYITDAFHVGYSSWLRYDDASVKLVQEEYVLKPQGTRVPYLLFYRRSDTIRSK